MSITARRGRRRGGRCGRKPWRRNSSARSARSPKRSSPAPPRPGSTRLGSRAGRADHPARRPRRGRRSSPRWTGRSRSAGGAPTTSARSSPPGLARRSPGRPGTRSCPPCRPCRPGRWPTTRSGPCHDRRRAAAARPRPERRAAAAEARRDAPPRAGAAGHRQDATLGAGGVPAHPGRGRDHRPGRLQRPHPDADRRVPGHQDPRGLRPHRLLDPAATFDYLASLEWITARENLCLVGPAGTGKSHMLVALGAAAVEAGHRVRYFTAAELVETLYRGLADNSVGRVIDTLLRNDLVIIDELGFAPLDDTGTQLLFRVRRRRLRTRSLGIASHWPFDRGAGSCPSTPPPSACSTGCCTTPHRRHRRRLLPHARSQSQRRNHPEEELINPRSGDFYLATSGDHNLAVDKDRRGALGVRDSGPTQLGASSNP